MNTPLTRNDSNTPFPALLLFPCSPVPLFQSPLRLFKGRRTVGAWSVVFLQLNRSRQCERGLYSVKVLSAQRQWSQEIPWQRRPPYQVETQKVWKADLGSNTIWNRSNTVERYLPWSARRANLGLFYWLHCALANSIKHSESILNDFQYYLNPGLETHKA